MSSKRVDPRGWLRTNWLELLILLALVVACSWLLTAGQAIWQVVRPQPSPTPPAASALTDFDARRAAGVLSFLAALGPRTPGSDALSVTAERIEQDLADSGWQVETQLFELEGVARRNIIARAGAGAPLALLGAHYDASPLADRDPNETNRTLPAPGANDGASGVAVLLELARTLEPEDLPGPVWLVFFDGQYDSQGEAVAAGVQAFIDQSDPAEWPRAAVMLDLLGGVAQQFTIDPAADQALSQQIWALAEQRGYGGWFAPELQSGLNLGQARLAAAGIPTAVIAGSDNPDYRTLQDTPDRIDPQGLARVGQLLQAFLGEGSRQGRK
jgi:glutaminyl-peptide cyclotransferase